MARYPSLYQINTRVWLRELSNSLGRPTALTDIPDAFLDHVAAIGFDYCYDKSLYDRLLSRDAAAVWAHLWVDLAYQNRLARFLENHDEPRTAHEFPPPGHQVAAVITFFTPGLRFLHEGQLEDRRVKVSMHLGRRSEEPVDPVLLEFYGKLLACLQHPEVPDGRWQLLEIRPAWEGNPTWDRFLAFSLFLCFSLSPPSSVLITTYRPRLSLFPSPFSLFLRHLSHLFCHFSALSGISKSPMLKMVFTEI